MNALLSLLRIMMAVVVCGIVAVVVMILLSVPVALLRWLAEILLVVG